MVSRVMAVQRQLDELGHKKINDALEELKVARRYAKGYIARRESVMKAYPTAYQDEAHYDELNIPGESLVDRANAEVTGGPLAARPGD